MSRKPSHRDLILLIGILVAIVIAMTTWVYSKNTSSLSGSGNKPKTTTSLIIRSFIKKASTMVWPARVKS